MTEALMQITVAKQVDHETVNTTVKASAKSMEKSEANDSNDEKNAAQASKFKYQKDASC